MKGITHFITGVALATFFPEVVQQAETGVLLPMIGGIAGLLPDTLDFKFAQQFETYDLEIVPDPVPNPDMIADALVEAMQHAYNERQAQRVLVHTIRVGADLWREYAIRFIPETNEVSVRLGPLVNTGQVPYLGTEPENAAEARRSVGVPLDHTYSDEYKVNIFGGPSFCFERENDRLVVHFLDWHRRWSHSFTVAFIIGLGFGVLFGQWAGIVALVGALGHILEDQLGYMGSNLFWPFTHKRRPGLQLIHSGDRIPNFLTVWTALALILFNLDRFSGSARLPSDPYLASAIGLPWLTLGGLYVWRKIRARRPVEHLRQADIIAELDERQ